MVKSVDVFNIVLFWVLFTVKMKKTDESGLSAAALGGLIVGICALLSIIIIAAVVVYRQRKDNRDSASK